MNNQLKAGFSCVNIIPPMGIPIQGYYKERLADGVLDDIEANAVALSLNKSTVILIIVDHCGLVKAVLDSYKEKMIEESKKLLTDLL